MSDFPRVQKVTLYQSVPVTMSDGTIMAVRNENGIPEEHQQKALEKADPYPPIIMHLLGKVKQLEREVAELKGRD